MKKHSIPMTALLVILLSLLMRIDIGLTAVAKPGFKKAPPRNYLVYYGAWDDEKIALAKEFDLVILHPGRDLTNVTTDIIRDLKNGKDGLSGTDDDVRVIAYVSIGEDEDVPRVPPSPDNEDEGPVYSSAGGVVTSSHNHYPARYLDELKYLFNDDGFFRFQSNGHPEIVKGQDGLPDENGIWHSYYVYAGDRQWQQLVEEKLGTLDRRFNVDGFFLDTVDTASPWGSYGWMERDMASLIKKIRDAHRDKYIIMNRGLFLFEKYAELIRPSIDGLMFECFFTEWDWSRHIGVLSPYGKENYDILRRTIIPNAEKSDGFHMFFLDYLNCEQDDFYTLLADETGLIGEIPSSLYISTPDLDKIFPPPTCTSPAAEAPPRIVRMSRKAQKKGGCELCIELEPKEAQNLKPGRDFYFDIRYSENAAGTEELPFLHRVPIDYRRLSEFKKNSLILNICGLDKGKVYHIYARLVGKNLGRKRQFHHMTLKLEESRWPDPVHSLSAQGMEKSVLLSWEGGESGNVVYKVYKGMDAHDLKFHESVKVNRSFVKDLENGKPYYFSVSRVSPQGVEGCLTPPVVATPSDCTPPPPPGELAIAIEGEILSVIWKAPPCEDLSGYYLYCFPHDGGLRLPLIVDKSVMCAKLQNLEKGKLYRVFVTSFDSNGNQSLPGEIKRVRLDGSP